jgi:hypothetical protein
MVNSYALPLPYTQPPLRGASRRGFPFREVCFDEELARFRP